jgi:uncharacterized protein (DUF4415 family)
MEPGTERDDLSPDEKEITGKPGDLASEDAVPARPRASSVMVSLRLDRRVFDELGRIAEERGETFSTTARDALRAYVRERHPDQSYPEAVHSQPSQRVSDNTARTWDDDDLRAALAGYEAACRRANMRANAWRSYVDYARRFVAWREGNYWPRGTLASNRPVPRAAASTTELAKQAERYAEQVEAAGLERPTVETYFRHAMFFVRWLDGQFQPGARLQGLS